MKYSIVTDIRKGVPPRSRIWLEELSLFLFFWWLQMSDISPELISCANGLCGHLKHGGYFSVSHCRAFIMFLLFQFNQKEAWRKNIIQFFSHFTLSVNLEDYESCRGDDNIENVVTALQKWLKWTNCKLQSSIIL